MRTTWELGSFDDLFELEDTHFEREENRFPNYSLSWSKHIIHEKRTKQKFHILCCCGGNRAVIVGVEIENPNTSSWHKLSTFIDHDEKEENFRACAFGGRSSSGAEFLILGGKTAVIKLVDVEQGCLVHNLNGHESLINDLKVSPSNESYLLSASTDESIRLWNLNVRTCVAVFAGCNGHRRGVLSISWDVRGKRFASSGVDGRIRLWDVEDDEEVLEALHARKPMRGESIVRGNPHYAEYPYFRSNKLHSSAADCVHWLSDDDFILSKSLDNEILLWTPDFSTAIQQRTEVRVMAYPPARDVTVLMKFQLFGRHSLFSRFSVDSLGEQLVVGEFGTILIWNLNKEADNDASLTNREDDAWFDFPQEPTQILNNNEFETKTIRATAFAPSGRIFVACSDDGTLYRWGPPTGARVDMLGDETETTEQRDSDTSLYEESSYKESSDEGFDDSRDTRGIK